MSTQMPDPATRAVFRNGAGTIAQIQGRPVHAGMRVRMYDTEYVVETAQPSGVGFHVFARSSRGTLHEFKTSELTVVADAPDPIEQSIRAKYPLVNITDPAVLQSLATGGVNSTPAAHMAAAWIGALHTTSWHRAMALVTAYYEPALTDATGFSHEYSIYNGSDRHGYDLLKAPKWHRKLMQAAADEHTARTGRTPADDTTPVLPAIAAPTKPRPPRRRQSTTGTDPVRALLDPASTQAEARTLFAATGYANAEAVTAKYAHLGLGLYKMTLANLLRAAVRRGDIQL